MRHWVVKVVVALVVALLALPGVSRALTDRQKALVGLGGVCVEVEEMTPEAKSLGLTLDQIKTDDELRLRKARIKVLTREDFFKALKASKYIYEAGGAGLLMVVAEISAPSKSGVCALLFRVDLKVPVRIPNDQLALGSIWWTGALGTAGKYSLTGDMVGVRDDVGVQVDRFINDYLAANPKR